MAWFLLVATAASVFGSVPGATVSEDSFRESITADRMRELGFNPTEYRVEIPLGPLKFQRSYVRVGEPGLFSTGVTERGTDTLRVNLNPRGFLEFAQDEARVEIHGIELTDSRRRTATLTQGFGQGATAGSFSLTHTDTYSSDLGLGFSRSRSNRAALALGLGGSFGLSASAEDSSTLAQTTMRTRKYDVALSPTGVSIPLVEYHHTSTSAVTSTSEATQMIVRTPNVKLGEIATLSASHSRAESSATGTDIVQAANLTAAPHERVTITASHVATDREVAPDTTVMTVGAQVRLRPDATVTTGLVDTDTEGVGTTSQRSVALALTPPEGKGLGLEASYVTTDTASEKVEPTIRVRLAYGRPDRWQVSGLYYDDATRMNPELGAGLKLALAGGSLGVAYSENAFDPSANAVRVARTYSTEFARPLRWGLSASVGYLRADSLTDATVSERLRIGLGGPDTWLGAIDLRYETGRLRTQTGPLPDGSTLSISLSRRIGSAELALTGKRAIPPGRAMFTEPNDELHLDLKAAW